MRGAVRPRMLAVAGAAVGCLVALGVLASAAIWGFRHGSDRSSTTVGGWLALLWISVAVGVVLVVVVALAAIRALRRPLLDLSRAADLLQTERLPSALREIEAGGEPAPRPGFSAPPELEGVAGALENLERFVHYHAKRAQHSDRDLGRLLTGAADRVGARARIAEGIDLAPLDANTPALAGSTTDAAANASATSAMGSMASALHRDAEALRALIPDAVAAAAADAAPSTARTTASELNAPAPTPIAPSNTGPSITDTVAAAARTTLRPSAVVVGNLEPAAIEPDTGAAVMVVLGEVLDAALASKADVVVWGSVQPEGYHFVIDAAIGERANDLAQLAEAMRERDPSHLPFGLRAAAQAGRRARLLMWLTLEGADAQWHVLVPPDSFTPGRVVTATPVFTVVAPRPEPQPLRQPVTMLAPEREAMVEPAADEPSPTAPAVTAAAVATTPAPDALHLAAAKQLGEALTNLFARLEVALRLRPPDGPGLPEDERTAVLVDGTRLVGQLQQAQLCSSNALRALLSAIDVAVGADRSAPLAGSARERTPLPYEVLTEIRERLAATTGQRVDSAAPPP